MHNGMNQWQPTGDFRTPELSRKPPDGHRAAPPPHLRVYGLIGLRVKECKTGGASFSRLLDLQIFSPPLRAN